MPKTRLEQKPHGLLEYKLTGLMPDERTITDRMTASEGRNKRMEERWKTKAQPATLLTRVSDAEIAAMDRYWRAANYLSVGQIYLLDNPLLKESLTLEHIKPDC